MTRGKQWVSARSTWPVAVLCSAVMFLMPSCGSSPEEIPGTIHTIETEIVGEGSISPSRAEIATGDSVRFQILPPDSYFPEVTSDCNGSHQGRTYVVSSVKHDCTISVEFLPSEIWVIAGDDDVSAEEGQEVVLHGVAESLNREIASWKWRQITGDDVELQGADTDALTFVAPESPFGQKLVFVLVVQDTHGAEASDVINVFVTPAYERDPVADAGPDQHVEPGQLVMLGSSGSHVPGGSIESYSWSQISGPTVDLASADSANPEFTAPDFSEPTALEFELVVTSSAGRSAEDQVSITVDNLTEAPSAPIVASAYSTNPRKIRISWLPSASVSQQGVPVEYTVHLSSDGTRFPSGQTAHTLVEAQEQAVIGNLEPDTTYFLWVSAHQPGSRYSWSPRVEVTTAATPLEIQHTASYATLPEDRGVLVDSATISWDYDSDVPLPIPGEVLFSDDIDQPVFRVVENVELRDGRVIIETRQASFVELYESIDFSATGTFLNLPIDDDEVDSKHSKSRHGSGSTGPSASQFLKRAWPDGKLVAYEELKANTVPHHAIKTQNNQQVENWPIRFNAPNATLFKPGATGTVSISANIMEPESGFRITGVQYSLNSPQISMQPTAGTGIGQYEIDWTEGEDLESTDITFSWTPSHSQVSEHGSPHTLRVTVVSRATGSCWFRCTRYSDIEIPLFIAFSEPAPRHSQFGTEDGSAIEFRVDAGIDFEPTIQADFEFSRRQLKSALIKAQGEFSVSMGTLIAAAGRNSSSGDTPLFSRRFVQIYMAGPVPIIVVYRLDMSAAYEASALASLSLQQDFSHTVNFWAGMEYGLTGWEPISGFSDHNSFTLEGHGSGGAQITVKLIPEISVSFYEVATSRIRLEPYLYAEAHIEGDFRYLNSSATTDFSAMYRFNNLEIGRGFDLGLNADLTIWDYTLLGWPSDDSSEYFRYPLLQRRAFAGLPSIHLSPLNAPSDKEAEDETAGQSFFFESYNHTTSGAGRFDHRSSDWLVFPSGKDDDRYDVEITEDPWMLAPDGSPSQVASFCVRTDDETLLAGLNQDGFRIRHVGSADWAQWAQMFETADDIALPGCPSEGPDEILLKVYYLAFPPECAGSTMTIHPFGTTVTEDNVDRHNAVEIPILDEDMEITFETTVVGDSCAFYGWGDTHIDDTDSSCVYLYSCVDGVITGIARESASCTLDIGSFDIYESTDGRPTYVEPYERWIRGTFRQYSSSAICF